MSPVARPDAARLTRRAVGAAIVLLCVLAVPVRALEVQEVRWGFDGRAVPGRINILSVLLTNSAGEAYEGTVSLHKESRVGQRVGAVLAQPCFVAPFAARWVQFYPHVKQAGEGWVLTLGKRRQTLAEPKVGAPSVVYITDPENPVEQVAGLRAFPENLFPVTVAATDGLFSVVLDHVPRWGRVRRQAFVDWLRRGGTVHLLRDESGDYPEFAAELSALNSPGPRLRVGAGLVVRHAASAREVNRRFLDEAGFAVPSLKSGSGSTLWDLEQSVLTMLRDLVQPDHNWAFIYGALLVYVILVGPINYLIGRKVRDFRPAVICFIVSVLGLAAVINAVGRRGYGEAAAVHTLSYARPIEGATYDVTQWTNVFVLRGDYYAITHPADHNLYSTCQDYETVNGLLQNGMHGTFLVDVPLYSNRGFVHRARMRGHDLGLRVAEWRGEDKLEELAVAVGPHFPHAPVEMWARHGNTFYQMRRAGGRIEAACRRGVDVETFLDGEELRMGLQYMPLYGRTERGEHVSDSKVFSGMVKPLIARGVGGTEAFPHYFVDLPTSRDRVELFIFAESPGGFRLTAEGFGDEVGYVLYHADLFRPGNTDDQDR